MSSYTGYIIGYTALSGLYIIPLTVLWFITFCLARKHHDPARVGISWLKAVFPVWTLGLLLALARASVQLFVEFSEEAYYMSAESMIRVQAAIQHIAATASFLGYLASIFLFITFVELAGGYMLCLKNPAEPSRTRKFGRIGILIWGAVLFVLALALFANRQSLAARITSYEDFDSWDILNGQVTNLRLEGAVKILLWLTSIPMVGLASFTVHKAKNHPILRSGSVLYLVATILDLIRHTITMAIFTQGYLSNTLGALTGRPGIDPATDWVVDSFFNYTCMFVALVILFSLAIRTTKGLWSQPQPGWAYPTVAIVPTVPYPPGQVPVGVAPAQPQYMQQQQPAQPQYMQQQPPAQGLPAYLQVAQQQQHGQGQQGYYYYPQQTQQQPQQQMQQQQGSDLPQPVPQQQTEQPPAKTDNV